MIPRHLLDRIRDRTPVDPVGHESMERLRGAKLGGETQTVKARPVEIAVHED